MRLLEIYLEVFKMKKHLLRFMKSVIHKAGKKSGAKMFEPKQ